MPGVDLPRLVVTLRTAQSFAALDFTRRCCRALTLPHLLSRTAFAIRTCSRRTSRSTRCQSIEPQQRFEGAQALRAFFRFPPSGRFSKFSRDGSPAGRGLPFGPGATSRIRPITGRHSLFPASCPVPPWAFLAGCLPWDGCERRNDPGLEGGREDRISTDRNDPGLLASRSGREERSGHIHHPAEIRGSKFRFYSPCEGRCLLSAG